MRKLAKISGLFAVTVFAVALLAGSANAGWSIVKLADDLAIERIEMATAEHTEKAAPVAYSEGEALSQVDELNLLETQRFDG